MMYNEETVKNFLKDIKLSESNVSDKIIQILEFMEAFVPPYINTASCPELKELFLLIDQYRNIAAQDKYKATYGTDHS